LIEMKQIFLKVRFVLLFPLAIFLSVFL